jgi:ParB family chromosome partitioning protein
MAKTLIEGATRGSHFKLDPNEVIVVGLDTDDGPEHPLWDKRVHLPLNQEMTDSIIEFGVVQPIRVVVDADGKVYVSAGRQRVRNARVAIEQLKAAGEEAEIIVPAIAEKIGDGERHAQIAVVENAHRTASSILDKAEDARRMIDRGTPIGRVALINAVSVPTVQSWLALLDCSTPVKAAVIADKISPTAAVKLAGLPAKDQRAALELAIESSGGKRVSVKAATKTVNPDAVTRPSKRVLLRAIEAMPESPFADGIRFALGLQVKALPDAVAVALESKEAAQ